MFNSLPMHIRNITVLCGVTACDQTDQEPFKQLEETRRKNPMIG